MIAADTRQVARSRGEKNALASRWNAHWLMERKTIMRSSYTRLYIHLVWGTWDRLPLITIESSLYAGIAKKCYELKCSPLAIGGIEDHIHLSVRIHAATSVSLLVKEVKGSSSHLATHVLKPGQFFKWQGSYGALSCREQDIPRLKAYITNALTMIK